MNVPIRFTTSLVSVDWRLCQKNLGIGVIALQNIEGEGLLTSTDFSIPLAAHGDGVTIYHLVVRYKQH